DRIDDMQPTHVGNGSYSVVCMWRLPHPGHRIGENGRCKSGKNRIVFNAAYQKDFQAENCPSQRGTEHGTEPCRHSRYNQHLPIRRTQSKRLAELIGYCASHLQGSSLPTCRPTEQMGCNRTDIHKRSHLEWNGV